MSTTAADGSWSSRCVPVAAALMTMSVMAGGCSSSGDEPENDRTLPPPATTTSTIETTTSVVSPLDRYAQELTQLGEELTGDLADQECELLAPDRIGCTYWTRVGCVTVAEENGRAQRRERVCR